MKFVDFSSLVPDYLIVSSRDIKLSFYYLAFTLPEIRGPFFCFGVNSSNSEVLFCLVDKNG